MKVKVKIEEMFNRKICYEVSKKNTLADNIISIIKSKLKDDLTLRKGESRKTIIDALSDYQYELLPSYYIYDGKGRIFFMHPDMAILGIDRPLIEFYNYETRTITITKTKGGSK